jgi:hypothetical protein
VEVGEGTAVPAAEQYAASLFRSPRSFLYTVIHLRLQEAVLIGLPIFAFGRGLDGEAILLHHSKVHPCVAVVKVQPRVIHSSQDVETSVAAGDVQSHTPSARNGRNALAWRIIDALDDVSLVLDVIGESQHVIQMRWPVV